MNKGAFFGFLIVVLVLSAAIDLYVAVDTLFLWEHSGSLKWNIFNPDGSQMIAITAGLYSLFVFALTAYVIHGLLNGKDWLLGLCFLLGWYFLAASVVFGLNADLGRKFQVDFFVNLVRGGLLLFAARNVRGSRLRADA